MKRFICFLVTLAMLVLIDFGIYIAGRYRERYLEEAKTELDDILIQLPASRMLDLSIALSVAGAIITVVITSTQSDQIGPGLGVFISLIIGAALFPVPRFVLRFLRAQRLIKFNQQLEDALGMISSSLKAGFSINQALEKVSEQDLHPIALEFRLLMQELQLGVPLDQALENMSRRVGSDDFELVSTAIITARQTGGELTETLERVRISNKVRALTAMGRLQAIMIGAMPFLLLFGMYQISPRMMDSFMGSILGVGAMIGVVVLVIAGFFTIRKITNVEV